MLHEQIFEADGKAWNAGLCEVAAKSHGVPLILFHGVTRRWQSFVPVIPALSSRFQIFAFDFPGHGRSDRTNRGYRVSDYVDYAAALLSTPPFSTQRECVIYGHSLGSMVAAAVAGRLGSKVKAVVLEDPPFHTMGERIASTPLLSYFQGMSQFAGSKESLKTIVAGLAELRITDPASGKTGRLGDTRDAASLRFTARSLAQLDPRAFETMLAGTWLDGYDVPSVLRELNCPALLLQADPAAGGMLTDADAAMAADLAADLSVVRIANAPHLIHWSQTETLLRAVQSFLEST